MKANLRAEVELTTQRANYLKWELQFLRDRIPKRFMSKGLVLCEFARIKGKPPESGIVKDI